MASIIYSLSRIFSRQAEEDETGTNHQTEDDENQTQVWYHRPRSRTVKHSLNSSGIKNPLTSRTRQSAPPTPKYSSISSSTSVNKPELKHSSISNPSCGGFFDTPSKTSSRPPSRGKPRGRRNIMWEDSGYNTPSVKALDDSLDEISNSYSYYDASTFKSEDDDFSKRRSKVDAFLSAAPVFSGEKFGSITSSSTTRDRHSSEKAVKYTYDGFRSTMPDSESKVRSRRRTPSLSREEVNKIRDSVRSQSRSCSWSRERNNSISRNTVTDSKGMSPTFTNHNSNILSTIPLTPSRSKSRDRKFSPSRNSNADYHLLAESFVSVSGRENSLSRKSNTFYSLENPKKVECGLNCNYESKFFDGDYNRNPNHMKLSSSTSSLLSPSNEKFYLNTLEETKMMVDENVNQILTEGTNEFNDKYSKWIQQVFHLQLSKIQSRLSQSFQTEIGRLNREKENEIIEIQQSYRKKLLELESSTEKFQEWFDNLTEENQQLRNMNNKLEFEMNSRSNSQERQFNDELDKQINEIEAMAEQEKLQLQKRHAEQIHAVTTRCNEQVKNLEAQYSHQIESLEKLVDELRDQNDALSQHLELYKKFAGEQATESCIKHPSEREQLLSTINELREKLAILEREKTMVIIAHNDEIVDLHKELEEHNKQFNAQIKNSQIIISNLQRSRVDDMAEMQERLQAKEKEYQIELNSLRSKYGQKISELTETVSELQDRLVHRAHREIGF